jgi:dTDP-4-amino-4,6-dideoxygalactose transaminase
VASDHELIDFNRTHVTGNEFDYMREAIGNAHLASGGPFTRACVDWLRGHTGCRQALLTHSCTAALELACTLAEIGFQDEVIMPSFTFVTTANAVVGRGGLPVFVDIRSDTLCIDEQLIEGAITARTKAIVPVHYAGIGAEMDRILDIAQAHGLLVIEDAAQGIGASIAGKRLGGIGHLGALSFHETKNVTCGEGGALLVNDERFLDRAEIVLEKGTDRRKFARGEVEKYTWVDEGSSYALSDLAAAYLWAQLEAEEQIRAARLQVWHAYDDALADLEEQGLLRRPITPAGAVHNAHMYYVLVNDLPTRSALIAFLASRGITAVFHYVPLHSSPAGHRYARANGELPTTTDVSQRLVRLPLWVDLGNDRVAYVTAAIHDFFEKSRPASSRGSRTASSRRRAVNAPARPQSPSR